MKQSPVEHRRDLRERGSGVLLHVTSLPGRHGCGDLGGSAHEFVEFLQAAGQGWWQMLPIGPCGRGPGWSPYDSPSSMAGSPWLVSLELLAEEGLLERGGIRPGSKLQAGRVNFQATLDFREERLRQAFAGFRRRGGERRADYRTFCARHADWLEDFALFMALRWDQQGRPWTEWPEALRRREPRALREARGRLADEIAARRFVQFEFDRQWGLLRARAERLGVGLIGDLPIFVAHDSADVWAHQELFRLERSGRPAWVSGYPPDRFNRAGQCWGHPQYRWRAHEATGFRWWVRRVERMFELFDAVRIDHFLGFTRTWSIPANGAGPAAGRWVKSPGAALFGAVRRKLGELPLVAEDLGYVTPADIRLRDAFGMAPMRLFQFGFGAEPDSGEHLPHRLPHLCVAYSGNHDNDTTVGWFRSLRAREQRRVLAYTGGQPGSIARDSLRVLMASPANLVMFPLQDVLGLGSEARMNVPGTTGGNWAWRAGSIPGRVVAKRLRELARVSERCEA